MNGQVMFKGSHNSDSTIYAWDFGDGSNDSGYVSHHLYASAGTYYACLTVSQYDTAGAVVCTATWCDSVSVQAPIMHGNSAMCNASFRYSNIHADTNVRFMGGPVTGGIPSYSWDFGDGSTGTGHNAFHAYTASGVYNVCLTVTSTDSLGNVLCTASHCDSVTVGSRHLPGGWHHAFGPAFHRTNAAGEPSVSVYPNPFADKATIHVENMGSQFSFRLIDNTGRVVVEKTGLTESEIQLTSDNWPSGIYFYYISNGDQTIEGKLIKN